MTKVRFRLAIASADTALKVTVLRIPYLPDPYPITSLHVPHTPVIPVTGAHISQPLLVSIPSARGTIPLFCAS